MTRDDMPAAELRRLARREPGRVAARVPAVANALEGMARAEAAKLAGLERQALRDAALRHNAEGVAGLRDRPRPGRPARLDEARRREPRELALAGPDVEASGLPAWVPAEPCRVAAEPCRVAAERWGVACRPGHMGELLRSLGPSRQKARPPTPRRTRGRGAPSRGGPRGAAATARGARPGERLTPWSQDEARFGQKGRVRHRWFARRGRRRPGLRDRRHAWAHLRAAVRPATGRGFALVLPEVSARAMQALLDRFAARLAPDEHAALVLDQAGRRKARALRAPDDVTLVPPPPYAPEPNPVERVWLHLRERHLSPRLLDSCAAVVDAPCHAWRQLTPERLMGLTGHPCIQEVRV